jgi:hypothetical protein
MRITKVYTKTGDHGDTGLGRGHGVPKDDPRIEAYGTVDELNSAIGVAITAPMAARVRRAAGDAAGHGAHPRWVAGARDRARGRRLPLPARDAGGAAAQPRE